MASVWESKYAYGSKFVLNDRSRSIGAKSLNKISGLDFCSGDVFTKIKPNTGFEISHPSNNPHNSQEFWVEKDSVIFKISGSGNTIAGYFNHYKGSGNKRQLPKGITNTQYLESFALLGLLGIKSYNDAILYKNSELLFDPGEFSKVNDFTITEINSILNNSTEPETPRSFIHLNIAEFYSVLLEYENLKNIKDNTSDIVLIFSDHTREQLLEALKNKEPCSIEDGYITLESGIKFKQISLKLSPGGARLGRITSIFRNLTNLDFVTNFGNPESLILNINHKIEKLVNMIDHSPSSRKPNQVKLIKISATKGNIHTNPTETSYNLLACNLLSLDCLLNLIPQIKSKGAPEHISQIIDIMRRGSTKLPVEINYSDGSESQILNGVKPVDPRDLIESVIVTIHPSGMSHYVINLYYLIKLSENIDDSQFVKIQMTNAGGGTAISWKVEGNAITTYEALKNHLRN